ncbi:hypothetical protein ACHAXT_007556 [Thalassiosira profunda]
MSVMSDTSAPDPPAEATFTCPICLGDSPVDDDNSGDGDNPSFPLASCHHRFCALCLRAYVRSKLMDGESALRCCHFKLSLFEEDFCPCDAVIQDGDVYKLLHEHGAQKPDSDDWCCEEDGTFLPSLFGGSQKECQERNMSGAKLWEKYQKLKFDHRHGKDVVRRCPKCDKAQLFDEEAMKQYQSTHLTEKSTTSPSNGGEIAPTNRFERALGLIRHGQRGVSNDVAASTNTPKKADAMKREEAEGCNKAIELGQEPEPPERLEAHADTRAVRKRYTELRKSGLSTQEAMAKARADLGLDALDGANGATEGAEGPEDSNDGISDGMEGGDDLASVMLSGGDAGAGAGTGTAIEDKQSAESGSKDSDAKAQDEGNYDECSEECKTPEGTLNASEPGEATSLVKSTTPTVKCKKCDTEFCYFHSNAHAGKSCVEYHKKSAEQERSNVEYASRVLRAKPCPTCGIAVSKEGGCNQMKCESCGTYFCWICLKVVDDGAFPEHFRWWNLRGCANMQLDEHSEPLSCTIWAARLLSVFQIVVLGVPALVLTLVSMLLCPCLIPGCGNTNRERVVNAVSFWGSFLSSMLLLPFTCVGMLILSVMYCFLAAIAFIMKAFKSQKRRWRASRSPVSAPARAAGAAPGGHPGTSAARRDSNAQSDGDAAPPRNAESGEDIIRALEAIFERMEEGISSSNSSSFEQSY